MDILKEIEKWLENIDTNGYDYVVFNSYSPNLQNYLLSKSEKLRKNGLSHNGLILKVPEIAKYYELNGKYPRILFIDPIIVFGDKQNEYFNRLEKAISNELEKLNIKIELNNLRKELCNGIAIYVYCLGSGVLDLQTEYQWRIKYSQSMKESEWRKIHSDLSRIPKTPHTRNDVLTFACNPEENVSNRNFISTTHNDSSLYALNNESSFATIYSYNGDGKRFYTPYLFIDNINLSNIIEVLNLIMPLISKQNSSLSKNIASLFNDLGSNPNNLHIYAILSDLLISQVYLNYFINGRVGKFNIDMVSRSYGIEGLKSLLKELTLITIPDEAISDINSALVKISHFQSSVGKTDDKRFIRNIIYELGLEKESKIRNLNCNTGRRIGVKDSLNIRELLETVKDSKKDTLKCLLYLLEYIKMNACTLETLYRKEESRNMFYKAIFPTELTLGIMPQEIGQKYYESFFRFAQFYWREDDLAERTHNYFSSFLPEENPIIEDATYFADSISRYRKRLGQQTIVGSMINWRSIM